MQIGGLFLGGMTLPRLLHAEQASSARAASGGVPSGSQRQRGVIMIYMPGGPPHQDMYDLKPDAPSEVRGEFDPIATSVPGIDICELMPRLAQRMDRFSWLSDALRAFGR